MLAQMTGDGLGSRLRFVPMFFFPGEAVHGVAYHIQVAGESCVFLP